MEVVFFCKFDMYMLVVVGILLHTQLVISVLYITVVVLLIYMRNMYMSM